MTGRPAGRSWLHSDPVLTHVARRAPRVHLEIRMDRRPLLMDALESGDIGLAIATRQPIDWHGFALRACLCTWFCATDLIYDKRIPMPLIVADEPSILAGSRLKHWAVHNGPGSLFIWLPRWWASKLRCRAGFGDSVCSVAFLGPGMRVLEDADDLPPLRPVTYTLWTLADTINPLILTNSS